VSNGVAQLAAAAIPAITAVDQHPGERSWH
jgi:hypothetical protein